MKTENQIQAFPGSAPKQSNTPYYWGVAAAAGLLLFYLAVLSLAESVAHAWQTFTDLWYWILVLAAGFGVQVGLFAQVRHNSRQMQGGAKAQIAATSGVSAGAMVACCLHHLVDLLPVFGLSAAAVFLTAYQLPFILFAVGANIFGILLMLSILHRQRFSTSNPLFRRLLALDLRKFRIAFAVLAVAIVTASFLFTATRAAAGEGPKQSQTFDLQELVDDRNAVTIKVTPEAFRFGEPLRFQVRFDTHEGNLDFDPATISYLEDGKGNVFRPLFWEGSAPGGHHRSGVLTFPAVSNQTREIHLTLENLYGIPARTFDWTLFN
jgi:hypothetical protein